MGDRFFSAATPQIWPGGLHGIARKPEPNEINGLHDKKKIMRARTDCDSKYDEIVLVVNDDARDKTGNDQ